MNTLEGSYAFGIITEEEYKAERERILQEKKEQQESYRINYGEFTNPFRENNNNNNEIDEYEDEEAEEYEETETCESLWYVPMPTRKEFISNKNVDYRIIGGLMLNSNSNASLDFMGVNDRGRRYIMGHKMDSVIEEIASTVINPKTKKPLSKSAVAKHIRVLKKLGAREFSLGNKDGKLYYNLQFGEVDEVTGNTKGGDYVTVSSEKLRALVTAYSSNSIKLYTILLWKCWDNKNQCFKPTHVPYETLMNELGINDKTTLRNCLWALQDKFITIETIKRREHILDSDGEVRSVLRAYNYYNIIEY